MAMEPLSPGEVHMGLRYGVNEADSWWHFAAGPQRECIWSRLRDLDVRIIRIFVFDKGTPDPVRDWPMFESYIRAVLNTGATPMITFAKCARPVDDARARRWFANRCADVVWSCIDRWGGEEVRGWYWCLWNEPNSTWIGGGLTFELYREIYQEVGYAIRRWLDPYLNGGKLLMGGPAVEGFEPFWMDWIWRFVHEIDPALIGFVNWHRYADWRACGEAGAPADEPAYKSLILAQAPDYEERARSVDRLLNGAGVQNVCGEWNAHSHYLPAVRARFNQSVFGAVFGAAALMHLLRGGVDAEMLWTGTDDACGYGLLDKDAVATPMYHVKRLFARYVRYGDRIRFPCLAESGRGIQTLVARGDNGRCSAVLVHLDDRPATYDVAEAIGGPADFSVQRLIDSATGNQIVTSDFHGTTAFAGHGVAFLTNLEPART